MQQASNQQRLQPEDTDAVLYPSFRHSSTASLASIEGSQHRFFEAGSGGGGDWRQRPAHLSAATGCRAGRRARCCRCCAGARTISSPQIACRGRQRGMHDVVRRKEHHKGGSFLQWFRSCCAYLDVQRRAQSSALPAAWQQAFCLGPPWPCCPGRRAQAPRCNRPASCTVL